MGQKKEYLNVIRCISTCIIVLFHYCCTLKMYKIDTFDNWLYQYAGGSWGTIGVNIFFLLSGACLLNSTKKKFFIKEFYKKRFLRIFPMFYLAWLPCYVLRSIIEKNPFWGGKPVNFLWTFLGMDGYFREIDLNYSIVGEWFTGAIIIIYLLFPILRYLFAKFRLVTTIVLLGAYILNCKMHFPTVPGRAWLGEEILIFWLGLLIAEYEEVIRKKVNWIITVMLSVIFILVDIPFISQSVNGILLSLCIFISFMLVPLVFLKWRTVSWLISWIAKYSYAIYLSHHVILVYFIGIIAGKKLSFIQNAILVVLLLLLIGVVSMVLQTIEEYIVTRCQRIPKKQRKTE